MKCWAASEINPDDAGTTGDTFDRRLSLGGYWRNNYDGYRGIPAYG